MKSKTPIRQPLDGSSGAPGRAAPTAARFCRVVFTTSPPTGHDAPDGPHRLFLDPSSTALAFIPAGTSFRADDVAEVADEAVICFEIAPSFLAAACGGPPEKGLRHGSAERDAKTAAIARHLSAVGARDVPSVVTDALWIALSRAVGRKFGDMPSRPGDAWMSPAALERVVRQIEHDLASRMSVEALARTAGLSQSAFLRAFRGATGMTPSRYLINRRLVRSAAMLVETPASIAEVASASGFGSPTHFATTFLAWRGETPTAFRRRRRAESTTD